MGAQELADDKKRNIPPWFAILARPFLMMFNWHGRAMRREVLIAVAMLPLFLLPDFIFSDAPSSAWILFNIGLWLVLFVGTAVRRYHDCDRDGWGVITIFIPYIGWGLLLIALLMEGTMGANRFGNDPRWPSSH